MNKPPNVRVALDAMGGDFAPRETVAGGVAAAEKGVEVFLVGDPAQVKEELNRHKAEHLPIVVVPSSGVIEEGESPVQALKEKPQASILVSAGLIKAGKADALVSMGSTGATMAASIFAFGLMDGIERPALGGPIIGLSPRMVMLDVGSNLDCRPSQMVKFGALGAAFSKSYFGISNPRVALLSVGAEEGKGNRQAKEAYALLKESGLNFQGNIEGHDLAGESSDVVVCDGFVGNVVMKLSEGIGYALSRYLDSKLRASLASDVAQSLVSDIYNVLNSVESSGGGPLFGINGIAVIGHGRAHAASVERAILTARYCVQAGLLQNMSDELKQLKEESIQS